MPQQPATSFADDLQEARQGFEDDLKAAREHVESGQPVPHPIVQRLLDWLPAATGLVGGLVGGGAGAAAGGIGAIPGAVAGAALGGATGEAWKQLANRALGNPTPQTPGLAGAGMATQAAVQGGSELVGGMVAPVLAKAGSALMQSAVKPGIRATARALAKGSDSPIVKTLLDEGINVSSGGIAKLNRIMEATNKEISDAIQTVGGSVSPSKVATRTDALAAKYGQQVNPLADVGAVDAAKQEFLATQTKDLTLPEAQRLKTGTYRSLSEKAYGEMKAPAIEAQKALARGLKEDIEAEAAKSGIDLGKLNAREGAAIQAKEAIARRLAVSGNRDPVALAWLAHNPVTGLLFIMERSPAVKSMLARGMVTTAAKAARLPTETLRLMLTAIASSSEDQ